MTVAHSPASRDARIYRVNAWRNMKGRPALTFAELEPEEIKPGGPEWWTEANTAAWTAQQWRDGTQGEWGRKYQWDDKIRRGGASTYTPIKPKVMAKWRETDPRPTPTTFYDGTIDPKRAGLNRERGAQ